jgi:protein subunit release factor A
LESRLSEIEKQEQNPDNFSDFEKLKSIGTEKKSLLVVLEKINSTTKQIKDLFDLYELLSIESTKEEDWKDFDKEFAVAKIDVENAVKVGLLPQELREKCVAINNSSLLGTVKFAHEKNDLNAYVKNAKYVDLSTNSEFSDLFISNMKF